MCRLSHALAQFPLTTSETELDYYQQKVNLQVASRVVKRWLDLIANTQAAAQRANFDICAQNRHKSAVRKTIEKQSGIKLTGLNC